MAPPSSPQEKASGSRRASLGSGNDGDDTSKPTKTPRKAAGAKQNNKARLRQELHDLHQEMEVAHYGRQDKTGNLRRVVPRHKSGMVTARRQSLEQQDRERHALHETSRKLLRKTTIVAMEQAVQKSAVFGGKEEEEEEEEEEPQDGQQSSSLARAATGADGGLADPDEEDEEEEEDEGEGTAKRKSQRISRRGRHKAKKMVRLRAFKSQRLAQREGEAIALHIQGRHLEAIAKLKEIAVDKPSAPQVYSCLGTVYEAMFDEALQQGQPREQQGVNASAGASPKDSDTDDAHSALPAVVRNQIELATKAYGSFHVAAILYKKDYALWVRGADISARLADLYGDILTWPDMPGKLIDLAKKERKRWLLEAKNDYHAAENLRPPGINVGAKLARIYMQLGSLSEAFTLLTEMQGSKNRKTGRKEFDASYRAWMLYADLNLQIGYECEQWNQEDFSNNDYVFRRWLRKYAATFNWRERSIQALIKALEAAAGTQNCKELHAWLKGRAGATGSNSTQQNSNAVVDEDEDEDLLAEKHANELANFDRTTSEMNLPEGSKAAELRAKERVNIALQSNQKLPNGTEESTTASGNQSGHTLTKDVEFQLPVSASVSTVVNICTRLMHLLLTIGSYEGCHLVGEAASSYLKERFRLFQQQSDRISMETRNDSVVPEKGAPYDILTAGSDDDDSVMFLSDDEELRNEADESVFLSLEKGILPPIILTLYGIALLAAGKRKFLARKCIQNIQHVSLEEREWFKNSATLETTREASSSTFNEKYIQIPGRFTLFVLLSRMILSSEIHDLADVLSCMELFEGILDWLWSMNIVPSYQVAVGGPNSVYLEKLSGIREIATTLTTCLCRLVNNSPEKDSDMLKRLAFSLRKTTQISCSLWSIDRDGCLDDRKSRIALKSVSEAIQILIQHAPNDLMNDLMGDILLWLARFCVSRVNDFCNFLEESAASLETSTLPIDVEWLTASRSKLSVRCYNLVVSCAVESFSGWNMREFSMGLIRFSDRHKYVGLIAPDGRVSGHLRESMRHELTNQWTAIQSLNPNFTASEEIIKRLQSVQTTDWYLAHKNYFRELESAGFVARQCEMEALWICLFFSRISIIQAQTSQNIGDSRGHIYNAMSVLLPLSQYALNERLWVSRVGIVSSGTEIVAASANATPEVDPPVEEKEPIPRETEVIVLPDHVATIAPTSRLEENPIRKRKRQPSQTKPRSPFFRLDSEKDDSLLSCLVKLTSSSFQDMWKDATARQNGPQDNTESETEDTASSVMASLNEKVRLLRSCFSLMSVQRASLEIAADLLEVAAHPSCSNAYLTINHAANFASKGLRGGNSDRFFKSKLPGEHGTPIDMLLVLGRADCLNALGFPEEASFLVSFVAGECAVRRVQPDVWNDSWRFVSIYAYNLSVLVRVNEDAVFGNSFEWQQGVIEELSRSRDDGLKTFGKIQADGRSEDRAEVGGDDIDLESRHSKKPKSTQPTALPTENGQANKTGEQPVTVNGTLIGGAKQIVWV